MGKLLYAGEAAGIEMDDWPLAHLRAVILSKLRRGEALAFTWNAGEQGRGGRSTIWIHPAMPLQFDFSGGRDDALNRRWLEDLMVSANSPGGLRMTPEPEAAPAASAA